jgi:hypothetical protein
VVAAVAGSGWKKNGNNAKYEMHEMHANYGCSNNEMSAIRGYYASNAQRVPGYYQHLVTPAAETQPPRSVHVCPQAPQQPGPATRLTRQQPRPHQREESATVSRSKTNKESG